MTRRAAFLATLVVAASAAAQVKTVPKKPSGPVGPIIAGGSSTARAVAPVAPPALAPKAKPSPTTATKPAAPPPATVAAKPVPVVVPAPTKPLPTTVTPAKTPPPPPIAAKASAVAPGPAVAPNAANAASAGGASITIEREVFYYERGNRRDPFVSLLQSQDLRPALADLRLVGVVLDPRGRNSIAALRDITTKEQYRLRTGQTIGRLRVIQIQQRSVTFVIEEFGVTRQQVLSIRDSTRVRTP